MVALDRFVAALFAMTITQLICGTTPLANVLRRKMSA
jgi:hypothetical protein